MRLAVFKRKEELGFEDSENNEFHHAFIVPSEWEKGIREEIIRPIFIQADLILKDDHKDRLLFFSDIECICYDLQAREDRIEAFKRGRNTLLCRFASLDCDKALIKLDLIQTTISLFNFSDSKLFPKVVRSNSISINKVDIINCIKLVLKENFLSTVKDDVIEMLAEDIFNYDSCCLATYDKDDDPLKNYVITDTSKWKLNESQTLFIKSIRICDICQEFGTALLNNMKDIVSNNFAKKYKVLLADDQYSCEINSSDALYRWMEYLLEYNRHTLNEIVAVTRNDCYSDLIEQNDIISGAGYIVMETVQCSFMQCPPRLVSTENIKTSSSVFQNSKPDAIININISFKSTVLSFSLLDNHGLVENIFNHNYFTIDRSIPSLESFYNFSNTINLQVKEQFITFSEKYLLNNSNDFCIENYTSSQKEEIMVEIEDILNNNIYVGEVLLVSTEKQNYIKAFLLMYMFYILELILYELPTELNFDYKSMKIGYAVTVEKLLLVTIAGNKENFQELIFSSALVPKDDPSKILRIMTQEEALLPAIQQYLKLSFPIKSYFILAQLYDDYVQLTLNQVVIASKSEDEGQESTIFQDEIIPIKNIYEFSFSNLWNTIMEKRTLVQLCKIHKDQDDIKVLDLFSLETRTKLMSNLKKYISDNIFNENANLHTINKNTIQLNSSCSCNICFTVNDIIEICLKPALQEITVTLLASLINKCFFEIYKDIDYIFNLIHFNNNQQLQDILANIMKEEAENFNPRHGIETDFLVVSQLPIQLLHPVINKEPLSYKEFQFGTLHQVFTVSYAVLIRPDDINEKEYVCKNKLADKDSIKLDKSTALYLFKKGDIISNTGFNKIIYIKERKIIESLNITIAFFEYDDFEDDSCSPVYTLEDGDTFLGDFEVNLKLNELKAVDGLPIMISVVFKSHSCSFEFSASVIGDGIENYCSVERGELMALDRF